MNRLGRALLLALAFLAFVSVSSIGHSQQNAPCDECSAVQDALKAADQLRPGMTRKDVEVAFKSDGGLETGRWGRYVFRRCPTIKIDVQFDGEREGTGAADLPTDKVRSISR